METSTLIFYILYSICFIYAFYLSWRCNSTYRMKPLKKLFYAIFAGLLNFNYLVNYYFFKSGMCTKQNIHTYVYNKSPKISI